MEERQDLISRQAAIDQLHQSYNLLDAERRLEDMPSAQPDNDMIHLQKEQAYLQGWEEGREALRKEQRWIPCVDGNEPKANADCWISTNAKYVRRASYAPKANNQPNGFIVTEGGFGFYEYGKFAKAWMPYREPGPYREEGGK